jgi:hypothetical protein
MSSHFILNLEWRILTATVYEDLHLYLHTRAVTTLLYAHVEFQSCTVMLLPRYRETQAVLSIRFPFWYTV